jgi:VCBS repeat-containing protein
MVAEEWVVTVQAPDADADGWRANVDCNDLVAAINPGMPEIIGNGIDDDCRPETLDGGTPPTASFTVAPGVKIVGQPVAFTDTSHDFDGPIAAWSWNFGDGQTSDQQHPSHVFAAAGIFKVVLTITDGQGSTATTEQSVTTTNQPVAAFTYAPAPAVRNTPIQFTDISVDLDGPLASWSWDFGDGGISNVPSPIHTFTVADTFTVTLTVTDSDGVTATSSQAVVVNPALTDTTGVQFKILHGCSAVVSYRFKVGGVLAGTLAPFTQSGCSATAPVQQTLTIVDPAILASITSPVCQVFSLESIGGTSSIGWARVEIGRPGGTEIIRIVNTNKLDGPTSYSWIANSGSGGARTFSSVLPNKDGDAFPDCSDPDIDNDGHANAVDNCPVAANANQADEDANGIGDVCQDTDADTFIDSADNCPDVANENQFDYDNDGAGNACDADIDADGFDNPADNCPYVANPGQENANGDAFGDACDVQQLRFVMQRSNQQYDTRLSMSIDGKPVGSVGPAAVPDMNCTNPPPTVLTITDAERLALLGAVPTCNAFRITSDNIQRTSWSKAEITLRSGTMNAVVIHDLSSGTFNASACRSANTNPTFYQNATPDFDKDGIFDCEDLDHDGDNVPNNIDNCPVVPNPDQADIDGNGIGNLCQDTDKDGDLDINDNCPLNANADQANLDGDAQGDVCDVDDDNDTVNDTVDNCPRNANTDQNNIDKDSLGDVCDTDMDGDGDLNTADNCPTMSNADQRNTDGDAQGDVCDNDLDNDGVQNTVDNCLYVANASQQSTNPYTVDGVTVGDACIVAPVTVPWMGVHTQPHQVFSGGSLVLQGVAVYQDTFLPADIKSATWDPGDGSGPVSINVSNPRALEMTYTYTGVVNTPYTAVLTIEMLNGAKRSDEFRVIIQPKTLDVEANMAIDRGLWNLHKSMVAGTISSVPSGHWTDGTTNNSHHVAATSATVQAFGINNHREIGNRAEDPYVDNVRRGMRFLENSLTPFNIGLQGTNNPDTNGNGIGLQHTGDVVYVTGQVADAFVAMGTPNAIAVVGNVPRVKGRTYRDIVQDIMDAYWWGQTDSGTYRGGWRYSWNGGSDNSTAQWGAITGLAGENAWNIPVPAFVKSENLIWVRASQDMSATAARGRLGYTSSGCAWSNCMSTTPSGMVQMIFDGVKNDPAAAAGTDEERFQLALKYIAKGMRNAWHTSEYASAANYYSLFAMAKAFRLAINDDGSGNLVPAPVTIIDDAAGGDPPFDWYRNDPVTPTAASPRGVARLLISKQAAAGNWPNAGSWNGSLATAYAVIVLSPTIFELAPAAFCSATPSIVGTGDPVTFDGSASVHNDPFSKIVSYSWDFLDGSAIVTNPAPNATVNHTFAALGNYNVLLTVTDQNGLTASTSCPVQVIAGNLPPTANAGGPYNFCAGSPMILDASLSTDPEGGPLSFQWDLTNPLNFTGAEGTTALFDATSRLSLLPPGTYQIGLKVTDDHTLSTAVFPNITIHAADNPQFCNTPPELTVPADIVTPATGPDGAVVEFEVTAVDAQDDDLTPVCTPPSGSMFDIGDTTVTCSVTDSGGLSDTESFKVTVTNNGPLFTPPDDITVFATSAAGAVVTFTAVGTDVESGEIPANCTPPSGSTFAIGTRTVNCSVSDGHLTALGSFNVTVKNNPPQFTPPDDITAAATSPAGAVVTFTAVGTDVEDISIPAACTRPSGDTFALGTTTLLCSVTDSHGERVEGTFTITVINAPPVAVDDAHVTFEDTPLNASVAGNDTDAENGALTFAQVSNPAHGAVIFQPGGSYTYTPASNYCGSDSFTYRANDGVADSNVATVTIEVTCVNDAPMAVDDTNATNEDTPVNGSVAANDTDVENNPLTFGDATDPAHGSVILQPNGSYTYTPDPNYCGTDSFTYRANDGGADSNVATVTIEVACVNDAPMAVDDVNATNEDTPLNGSVATNDADPENDALTFGNATDPAHGSVVLQPNGSYTYTPDPNYCGPDSFTYQANDGNAASNVATVTIAVACVNDAPMAVDDVNATNEDTPVNGSVATNDADPENDALVFGNATDPAHGSVILQPNGSYTYTPDPNYCGTDSFSYQANDGTADSNFAAVTIEVACVNDAPVAFDDANATNEDTPVNGSVATNDTDPEDNALTFGNASDPAHGSVTLNLDGSYTYTPDANYCGTDSFTYQANDGGADSNVATVTIEVACVNDAPVAADDANATSEDTPVTGSVAGNDSDLENNALTFGNASDPAHGSVILQPNGSYTYTPDANYCGTDSFTYQANDGSADSNVATVTIEVACVNDAPVAADDANATDEDTPVNGSVAANDSDLENNALTFGNASDPAHGSVVLQPNGSYTYTPDANYCGPDSFTYQANDGNADSNVATVNITVACVNDPPVAGDAAATTAEDVPVAGTVSSTDIDGGDPAYTALAPPSHGTVALSANGSFTYTPNANYNGADSFTYTVNDGRGGTDTGTVSIMVTPVNDLPVCTAAGPSIASLWPPNHELVDINVLGVTDPVENSAITIRVTAIFQDEPTNTVGDGNTLVDGFGLGTSTAKVRRERSGSKKVPGDGRMYYIYFTGTDADGGECQGTVQVGVPHDLGKDHVIGAGGPLYNSVTGAPRQ